MLGWQALARSVRRTPADAAAVRRGAPMVDTSASTGTASGASVPRDARPASIAACSEADVSWSRTTVCASTPLMKTGTWGGGRQGGGTL